MKITSKGQVTIPIEIREKMGLLPFSEVEFVVDEKGVRLVKGITKKGKSRGERIVERLLGAGQGTMTTDEIMAMTRGDD